MTTPTATGRTPIKLTDPAQLLAALPYLLGFVPEDSVVLLGHRPPGTRIGLTLRADLPPRSKRRQQAEALAPRMAATLHTGVTVIVIGGRPQKGGLPHRGFVDRLEDALAREGSPVLHSLWTPAIAAREPWGCYRDPDCGGVLPDPKASVAAAATVIEEGKVVLDTRDEVEAQLRPRSPEAVARRSEQLTLLREPPWSSANLMVAAADEMRAALERQRRGMGPPTDEQAVRLACALSIKPVRDACLATAVPAHSQVARDAEALWLTLVQELPAPERAEAAALLAFAAYLRGDCTFAGMAVANALDADPNHVFAELLENLIFGMVPPDRIAGFAAGWPGLEELARGATPGSG